MGTKKENQESVKHVVSEIAKGEVSFAELKKQYEFLQKENEFLHDSFTQSNTGSRGGFSIWSKYALQERRRSFLRKERDKKFKEIIAAKSKGAVDDLKKLVQEFNLYYKLYFIINDWSLKSFCSGSTDPETKNLIAKGIEICKEINNK